MKIICSLLVGLRFWNNLLSTKKKCIFFFFYFVFTIVFFFTSDFSIYLVGFKSKLRVWSLRIFPVRDRNIDFFLKIFSCVISALRLYCTHCQDLGLIFSQYGTRARLIRYIYWSHNGYFYLHCFVPLHAAVIVSRHNGFSKMTFVCLKLFCYSVREKLNIAQNLVEKRPFYSCLLSDLVSEWQRG